ncbi:hypothetical protein SAMN05192555_10577 [Franzmannia pantelleriensis]|uniref:Uncharacterized protein n=1 Tax=Franzmannia pantelleriensis TaxID=48727 RepID=A0A1G9KVX7_9GAMM|nr:hypothetical protein [Halomonas pantelleriensis]SDL54020.1 hypothetical protein SAMN05192555_10577 [Halomonas pantelleriensis]
MTNTIARWSTAALLSVAIGASAQANDLVKKPFAGSAMTPEQIHAWEYYLADESAQFGCQYGDDPRLQEDPRGTLQALASDEEMEPLKVTLRTFLFASDNVQTLLARNMFIASMECNQVYHFDGEMIGHPVLPYEEYLEILLHKLEAQPSLSSHLDFVRGTKIAAIDARWFWAFYLMDRNHYRMHGHDYDTIAGLAASLPGDLGNITPTNSHWQIFSKLFNQGIYVAATRECQGEGAEPGEEIVVDSNLPWETVADFYSSESIRHRGQWRNVVERQEQGFTLAAATLIDEPINPYFNVHRRVTIYPKECN